MRIPKFILLIMLYALLPSYAFAELHVSPQPPLPLNSSLPLECTAITGRHERLCIIQTESFYGPYDDIVFYHMNNRGNVSLLGSNKGDVATFGGFEFSDGGKYMWLSWAEEGHPHFVFYRTNDFIANGTSAKVLSVVGDYEFDQFIKFNDVGDVVYALADNIREYCSKAGDGAHIIIDPRTSTKLCAKHFKLE